MQNELSETSFCGTGGRSRLHYHLPDTYRTRPGHTVWPRRQERLDGENQYQAELEDGTKVMTDALKGVSFLSFPPVLHLQLKRFAYRLSGHELSHPDK